MVITDIRTLNELQNAAKEQNLTIEEKDGGYRVTRQHSIDDLSIEWREVVAGAGYTLTLKGLRSFMSPS